MSKAREQLQLRLQELARDLGRRAPALYLVLASSTAISACLRLRLCGSGQVRSSTHACTPYAVPVSCQPEVTTCTHDVSSTCCLPRAADLSSTLTGQQQAESCSQQLAVLMQEFPTHIGMQFLHQHQQQHYRQHYQHHHHHSYFDNTRRLLLFGQSVFKLYPAEPSKEVWLLLLQHLLPPEDLPATGRPHDMLLPRSASGLPMQPKEWVSRRVTIQHV